MDKVEETVPSAEEKEEEEEEEEEIEEEEKEGKDGAGGDKEEEDGDDEEQEGRDETEKKEEAVPQASDTVEKTIPLPAQPPKKEKKQNEGLNLNNEVVRMRKEVKRVRALVIRKLTRQMSTLKKKKGTDVEIERNQRRAARLLDEIHAMKVLSPDLVTKTALQKNLNFEQVCKNPKSTISDRATARIATHPQFSKKIENIKAAVQAFKAERMNGGKQRGKDNVQNKAGKGTPQSAEKKVEGKSEKEEDISGKEKEIVDHEEGDGTLKDTKDATVAEPEKETVKATPPAEDADGPRKAVPESTNVRPALLKSSEGKDSVKTKPQSRGAERKPDLTSAPEVLEKKKAEEESDVESSEDEEKEYFDDSTEERFNKQSSQSEESDDDGGFFVGKVSKYKKKKKQKSVEEEKADKGREVKRSDQVRSELDELESRLKSKATSLQSVFCSSLSKPGGGRGAGRGRGGDRFRGRGTPRGGSGQNRDLSKQSKFQKQEKGAERNSESKYSKEKGFPSVGRGRGRGRGDGARQSDRRGGGVFSQQAPQQALHPSWEASKKRKEQQGQILAFQGKKIKFDDDD
ncbi:serum response factor-binding protein 1 [Sander lucioperca]|uniref:Serum response factor-binding protein 1 n=1 Tax=Sander lucioperca TaxID=283035 RepID=A0A8D0DCT1_SANLU|nr:serum response factor-binding protein 1 [Sander lucioperca]